MDIFNEKSLCQSKFHFQQNLLDDEVKFKKELDKYYVDCVDIEEYNDKKNKFKSWEEVCDGKENCGYEGVSKIGVLKWKNYYEKNTASKRIIRRSPFIKNMYLILHCNEENINELCKQFFNFSFIFNEDYDIGLSIHTLLLCNYLKNDMKEIEIIDGKLKLCLFDFINFEDKYGLFYSKESDYEFSCYLPYDYDIITEFVTFNKSYGNEYSRKHDIFLNANNIYVLSNKVNNVQIAFSCTSFLVLCISGDKDYIPEIFSVTMHLEESNQEICVDNLIRYEIFGIVYYIVSLTSGIENIEDVKKVVCDKDLNLGGYVSWKRDIIRLYVKYDFGVNVNDYSNMKLIVIQYGLGQLCLEDNKIYIDK